MPSSKKALYATDRGEVYTMVARAFHHKDKNKHGSPGGRDCRVLAESPVLE